MLRVVCSGKLVVVIRIQNAAQSSVIEPRLKLCTMPNAPHPAHVCVFDAERLLSTTGGAGEVSKQQTHPTLMRPYLSLSHLSQLLP